MFLGWEGDRSSGLGCGWTRRWGISTPDGLSGNAFPGGLIIWTLISALRCSAAFTAWLVHYDTLCRAQLEGCNLAAALIHHTSVYCQPGLRQGQLHSPTTLPFCSLICSYYPFRVTLGICKQLTSRRVLCTPRLAPSLDPLPPLVPAARARDVPRKSVVAIFRVNTLTPAPPVLVLMLIRFTGRGNGGERR